MNKLKIIFAFTIISLSSCTETKNNDNLTYIVYEGIIPCADCEGIKLTLKISDDFQYYELSELYLGKSDNPFIEKGNLNTERGFEEDKDATVYVLNYDKSENVQKYFVRLTRESDTIIMLNSNREVIQSDLNYKLHRVLLR